MSFKATKKISFLQQILKCPDLAPIFQLPYIHLEFSTRQHRFKGVLCSENLVLELCIYKRLKISLTICISNLFGNKLDAKIKGATSTLDIFGRM